MQVYSDPSKEHDKWSLPDVEVWYAESGDIVNEAGESLGAGYYYWFCSVGCLPDGELEGPFETEQAAIDSVRESYWY